MYWNCLQLRKKNHFPHLDLVSLFMPESCEERGQRQRYKQSNKHKLGRTETIKFLLLIFSININYASKCQRLKTETSGEKKKLQENYITCEK